ncbi:MAG: hypothetical protein ACOYEB_03690 [Enterococcus lemanii]|jgi:hypothetical protein
MTLDPLTKDAQFVLHKIYKEYIDNVNGGVSKKDARNLGSGESLYQRLFSDQYYEDYLDTIRELGKKKYLNNKWASNKVIYSTLTLEAIELCEPNFRKIIKILADSATTIRNILP